MKFYRKLSHVLAISGVLVISGAYPDMRAAETQQPATSCDKAALAEIDYYTCEGARLRARGMALEAQARAQISRGQMMGGQCENQEDQEAARDCNMISSDLVEDSMFKRAEAADLLNEAERMETRAADLQKAQQRR